MAIHASARRSGGSSRGAEDIVVVGAGGTISSCPVFDLNDNNCQHYCPGDYITLGDTPTSVTQARRKDRHCGPPSA